MLLTQTSFCTPSSIKFSFGKLSHKTKLPFSVNNYEKNKLRSTSIGNMAGDFNNVDTFLASNSQNPLKIKLPPLEAECGGDDGGIGIVKFFKGKNIFITGGTGLLGKAWVEKILRSTSVGKIYLLVKANDNETALDRLSKEIIQSELFECLREKQGSSYEEFVREKLIPIVGNICEPNLGMDPYSTHTIMDKVDIIIQSAANTNLHGRYNLLLDANVNAPQRLMWFAKRCKNLKLFVHISTGHATWLPTASPRHAHALGILIGKGADSSIASSMAMHMQFVAYVNGKREGVIYEKPLVLGGNWRNEDDEISSCSFPEIKVIDEIKSAMKSCIASTGYDETKVLKKLGQERVAFYGYHNTYQLTKAMGEMVLNEIRGDIPLLVIRPSIIESSYKEPVPGWIQGYRVFDPVIISYGKGQLPAYLANPDVLIDIRKTAMELTKINWRVI